MAKLQSGGVASCDAAQTFETARPVPNPVPMRVPMNVAASLASTVKAVPDMLLRILRTDGERERTQRDALTAFSVRVASAAILYLSQIALARWIGAFDYGVYVFVWTWVLVLGGLSPLGLGIAAIRFLPAYRETGDLNLMRGLLRGGRSLAVASGTAVAALGMAGLCLFEDQLAEHYVLPIYLGLVCVPLYALTDLQDGIGRGQAWMSVALLPPYVLRPLLVLMAMSVVHLTGLPMSATTAAAAAIVATWGAALLQAVLLNQRLRAAIEPGPRRYAFGTWLKTSLPFLAIYACELAIQNTDVLVVSRYLSPSDVGIYFASAKTMSLIMFVHYAVGSAVASRFSALHARGDREALEAVVRDGVNWTFWPSLIGAAVILALGKPLLLLFGPQFVAGYQVMFILVVGLLLRSAMGPAEFLLNMLGEQKACAVVLTATAILNLVLNFTLVPQFGLTGAATATSLSLVSAALMNMLMVRQRLGMSVAIWNNLSRAR